MKSASLDNHYVARCYYCLIILFFLTACTARSTMSKIEFEFAPLNIHPREEWGSLNIESGYSQHEIKYVTLHHSGVVYKGDKPTPEHLRNLQNWSRSERPWPDIPYHFLIDLQGEIWEGRPLQYKGDTYTEYDPTSHALISVLGNYEEQEISPGQLESIADLMAALCKTFSVNPDEIRSHKDYVPSTLCPGKNLYAHLQDGSLIAEVKKRLQ